MHSNANQVMQCNAGHTSMHLLCTQCDPHNPMHNTRTAMQFDMHRHNALQCNVSDGMQCTAHFNALMLHPMRSTQSNAQHTHSNAMWYASTKCTAMQTKWWITMYRTLQCTYVAPNAIHTMQFWQNREKQQWVKNIHITHHRTPGIDGSSPTYFTAAWSCFYFHSSGPALLATITKRITAQKN